MAVVVAVVVPGRAQSDHPADRQVWWAESRAVRWFVGLESSLSFSLLLLNAAYQLPLREALTPIVCPSGDDS